MRLDKYLADAGIGTRSEVKTAIRKKLVSVNDGIVTDPGLSIADSDIICYKNEVIGAQKPRYIMMHKPSGCVCATKDREKTVLDYFPVKDQKNLFPVGRLDKDTEGLLLLTDDGMFAHNLTSPRKHVDKTYYFEGEGVPCPDAEAKIREGIDIGDDKPTLPATLVVLSKDTRKQFCTGELTISEGRYHQVKRMLAKMGVTVTYLKRLSIGGVILDPGLEKGMYRLLTAEEFNRLTGDCKK